MKQSLRILLLLFVGFAGISNVNAQEANSSTLKNILATKSFVFKAQSAWPLQGTVIQLNSGYDVRVLQDSINTYLPYFGRAFTASYNAEGGISFTSKKFDYRLREKQKGGWELTIRPSDHRDVLEMNYSVSANGYATLQVISNSRQAISYYGIIEKR
jgi:hypothetical protein